MTEPPLTATDLQAVWLSLRLAGITTVLLLILGTPLAWWLARSRSRWRGPVNALVALPLVLPPTVLGFYLLLAMGPEGPLGRLTDALGLGSLAFTFPGLVIASMLYSLPFVVQPLHNAMAALGERPLEAAATLRAGPWDRFFTVVIPLSRPGFVTAAILGFAHTLGEFGVVLRRQHPRRDPGACGCTTGWRPWSTNVPTGSPPACWHSPF